MTDEELLRLNGEGFFPGPNETEEQFVARVAEVHRRAEKIRDPIPSSHWDWVRLHLQQLFDFSPRCLPAFYSNRSLMPWQGAASWTQGGKLVAVQLRKALQKGSFLRIYQREEILAHEAVHAARASFEESRWEEFLAYMTSEKKWRRVLGPIVQKPWEVWPFFVGCMLGPVWPVMFLGAAFWAGIGFIRLVRCHRILKRVAEKLNGKNVRAILVRLTETEIERLSIGQEVGDESLRWRLLRLTYWR